MYDFLKAAESDSLLWTYTPYLPVVDREQGQVVPHLFPTSFSGVVQGGVTVSSISGFKTQNSILFFFFFLCYSWKKPHFLHTDPEKQKSVFKWERSNTINLVETLPESETQNSVFIWTDSETEISVTTFIISASWKTENPDIEMGITASQRKKIHNLPVQKQKTLTWNSLAQKQKTHVYF